MRGCRLKPVPKGQAGTGQCEEAGRALRNKRQNIQLARTISAYGSEVFRVGNLLSFLLFFAIFGMFMVLFRAFDKA